MIVEFKHRKWRLRPYLTKEQIEALDDEKESFKSRWEDRSCSCFSNPPCSFCTRYGDEHCYTRKDADKLRKQIEELKSHLDYKVAWMDWLDSKGENDV